MEAKIDEDRALTAFSAAIGQEVALLLTEADMRRFLRARKWVLDDAVEMAQNWAVLKVALAIIPNEQLMDWLSSSSSSSSSSLMSGLVAKTFRRGNRIPVVNFVRCRGPSGRCAYSIVPD
jgi:hypothetical protein